MMPMKKGRARGAAALAIPLAAGMCGLLPITWSQTPEQAPGADASAEFHFLRLEYVDLFGTRRGFGRGWWRQDWPAAEIYFAQGVRRLTRIDIGEGRHAPLTDDRIYDYPWVYATQVGYWNLTRPETDRLREYLLRGGFLVVDDFHGPEDWAVFRESMERVFPDRPIVDIGEADPLLHVFYDIDQRTQIPGLRHLRIGPGGRTMVQPQATPPRWRGIYDDAGRLVVAINFNMDIGDAWEHADLPEYPEPMTALAYRFGINYVIYSLTH